jgi:antitoxin VapB
MSMAASSDEENIGPFASSGNLHHPLDAAHDTIYTGLMPLNIRSEPVNQLAEAAAAQLGTTKTEAAAQPVRNELQRLDRETPLRDRLRALQNRVLSRPATGLEADKPFYDAL